MADPNISLDDAGDLLDKYLAKEEAEKKKKEEKTEKVKDLIKEGAEQGRAGLGTATRRLLDQIDD